MVDAYLKSLITEQVFNLLIEAYKDQFHITHPIRISKNHIQLSYGDQVFNIKITESRS